LTKEKTARVAASEVRLGKVKSLVGIVSDAEVMRKVDD
jgi:hypothetical protein